MRPNALPVAIVLMMVLSRAAVADSYAPFTNYRTVDSTGRFYVVVKKIGPQGDAIDAIKGVPVAFEIVERRPGSAAVASASDPNRYELASGAKPEPVNAREGDVVVGKGTLDRAPRWIVVSSTGLGFIGVDVYGHNFGELRNGNALVIVSKDGTIRHRRDLIDLYSESEVNGFLRTTGSVHWAGSVWIDERRNEIVVVSRPTGFLVGRRLYRIVAMDTGKVPDASPDVILAALADVNRGALDEALDLTAELKLDRAKPDLAKIFADESLALSSRLRAAVALAAIGDRQGRDLLRKSALENSEQRKYAIAHLPGVLGDDAAIVLCDIMRQGDAAIAAEAMLAMRHVSVRAGVPSLLVLLHEGPPGCRDAVIECLEWKAEGAKAAIPDLLKQLETSPRTKEPLWTQKLAALALGKIGPDAAPALPALVRLAERHEPAEWKELKDQSSKFNNPFDGSTRLSDTYFVDAILRIRRK
jgi:hypothetical protein